MTFAYANQMTEWTLWRGRKEVEAGESPRWGNSIGDDTDIAALASCTSSSRCTLPVTTSRTSRHWQAAENSEVCGLERTASQMFQHWRVRKTRHAFP